MESKKWEFKVYSYQIADTGDYDGHYEITNGDITLITKDDSEETERQLKTAVAALNRWGVNFYDQKVEDLSIDIYCMKDAQKWKDEEFAALQAKCDKYAAILISIKTIANLYKNWDEDSIKQSAFTIRHLIKDVLSLANEALSAGEGEKNKPKQWWEGKTIDELPEYVQVISEEVANDTGVYCKVFKWSIFGQSTFPNNGDWGAEIEGYEPIYLCRSELNFQGQVYGRLHASHLIPATEADYNAWKKEALCTMCNEKPKDEGLIVCKDCYEAFDGDRRGFWTSDNYQ